MTVFGVSMVRDEADIIVPVIEHMLTQVDEIIIADNGSVDGTRDLLCRYPITIVDDTEVGYYQSRKVTALAHEAGERGADWIVPFDADEVWYSPFGTVRAFLDSVGPQYMIATATLFDQVATALDEDEPDPTRRMVWRRRQCAQLPKVACRYRSDLVIEQGNHGAGYATVQQAYEDKVVTRLAIRHFPYRSAKQFVRKARNGAQAYAATDLPNEIGQHWRDYGALLISQGEEAVEGVFRQWFWSADPKADGLRHDPAPVRAWAPDAA